MSTLIPPPNKSQVLTDVRRVLALTENHAYPAGDWRLSTYLTPGMGRYPLPAITALFGDWHRLLDIIYPEGIKARSHAIKMGDPEKPPEPTYTKRDCLRCEKSFRSWGDENRLCQKCREALVYNVSGEDVEIYEICIPKSHEGLS